MTNLPIKLQFHHVGLACRKLAPEMMAHRLLGFEAESAMFHDHTQRICGIFMVNGPMRIELLEPAAADSPVNDMLKHGQKMYHQGFTCDHIHEAVRYLEGEGARMISPPLPAAAFSGKEISFLMLRTLLIVELIQK